MPSSSVQSSVRMTALLCALPFLTGLALWPVLRAGFIAMDDNLYVTQNAHVLGGPSFSHAWSLLSHSHMGLYHPLSLLSFMADHAAFGVDPRGYHAVNLAIHAANVVLLFLLLRKMTGDDWRSAMTAALFGVHPLRVESVAWVSERKDVLSIFFALLAFIAYVRFVYWRNQTATTPRAWIWYAVMTAMLVLSLLAKPTLVCFPFLLLALDYWPLGRMALFGPTNEMPDPCGESSVTWASRPCLQFRMEESDSGQSQSQSKDMGETPMPRNARREDQAGRTQGRNRRVSKAAGATLPRVWRLILEKLPLLVLTAGWAWMSRSLFSDETPDAQAALGIAGPALGTRILTAIAAFGHYLLNHVWLTRLAIPYPLPADGPPVWQVAMSLVVLALITLLAASQARRRPWIAAGFAWFLFALAPLLGIVYIGDYALADRYTYLADIGLFAAIVWSVPTAWAMSFAGRAGLASASAAILLTLVLFSRAQAGYWHDNVSLYGHAVRVTSDNATALFILAKVAGEQGDHALAIGYAARAARSAPDERIFAFIGNQYVKMNEDDGAIAAYRRAIASNPDYCRARLPLALALMRKKDASAARRELNQIAARAPDMIEAAAALEVLSAGDVLPGTIADCQRAIVLSPRNPALHGQLGLLLDQAGDAKAARVEYLEVIRLIGVVNDLIGTGIDAVQAGRVDEGIGQYRRALAMAPYNADAHLNAAVALLQLRRLDEAASECRLALASNPDSAVAHENMAAILKAMGKIGEANAELLNARRLGAE